MNIMTMLERAHKRVIVISHPLMWVEGFGSIVVFFSKSTVSLSSFLCNSCNGYVGTDLIKAPTPFLVHPSVLNQHSLFGTWYRNTEHKVETRKQTNLFHLTPLCQPRIITNQLLQMPSKGAQGLKKKTQGRYFFFLDFEGTN